MRSPVNVFSILLANCLSVPPSLPWVNGVINRGGQEWLANHTTKPTEKVKASHCIIHGLCLAEVS